MAQRTVQLIIGQILTDEEFRADFLERPIETLASLRDRGFELTKSKSTRSPGQIAGSGRLVRSGLTRGFSAVDSMAESGNDRRPGIAPRSFWRYRCAGAAAPVPVDARAVADRIGRSQVPHGAEAHGQPRHAARRPRRRRRPAPRRCRPRFPSPAGRSCRLSSSRPSGPVLPSRCSPTTTSPDRSRCQPRSGIGNPAMEGDTPRVPTLDRAVPRARRAVTRPVARLPGCHAHEHRRRSGAPTLIGSIETAPGPSPRRHGQIAFQAHIFPLNPRTRRRAPRAG